MRSSPNYRPGRRSSADHRPSAPVRWQADARHVEDDWEVVVVGGGPAGSTAALHLTRAGRRVLVLERAAYPRPKACGDLLIPDTIAALRRAGLYERVAAEAFATDDARISSPSRFEWSIPGDYLLLRRDRFDTILAEAAAHGGAVVARGRAEEVTSEPDGTVRVSVRGRPTAVRARFAVLATGADVSLLDRLGMLDRSEPTAVAVRTYVRSRAPLEHLFISFDREIVPGYAWAFPLPGGEHNLGVGVLHDPCEPARHDLRALFRTFTRDVPAARRIVEHADDTGRLHGARLRCGLQGARARGPGNILAVGEQIGTTYPFTGEGIGKAMETGEMAADAIHQAIGDDAPTALDDYADRLESELRPRYSGYVSAQRWLSRPWLNDLVARRARPGGFLERAAAGMVAETVDPRRIFSWNGVLRSVLG